MFSFFVFAFFFGFDVAQASSFPKMVRSLQDVPQSKIEEVFDILENLDIKPKSKNEIKEGGILGDASIQFSRSLSENELRVLVHGLDDPMHLIKLSPDDLFGSDLYRVFFFSRFNLHKDGNTLFTKLFSRGSENKELPFQEAKRNWESFLGAVSKANLFTYVGFKKIDLQAAAMSFIHRRFSNKYFPDRDGYYELNHPIYWDEESLGTFFHNQFNIGHYISSHFTLTPEDSYHQVIMVMISSGSFSKGENLSLINSKEFVLRIWNDVTEEISKQESLGISSTVFLGRIVNSVVERRISSGSSSRSFLDAMEEAAREDDSLNELMSIIKEFAIGGNLESYRQNIIQQFGEMPELDRLVISDFLSRTVGDFISQNPQRRSDPTNAGGNL